MHYEIFSNIIRHVSGYVLKVIQGDLVTKVTRPLAIVHSVVLVQPTNLTLFGEIYNEIFAKVHKDHEGRISHISIRQ